MNDYLIDFKTELENAGLIINGFPIMDGKFHRVQVHTDRIHKKSGSYKGYLDEYPAGFFENFKTGVRGTWKAKKEKKINMSPDEFKKFIQTMQSKKAQDEKTIKELQYKTALKLQEEYNNAKWSYNFHPYFKKKGLSKNYYTKQDDKGNILIKLQDTQGFHWATQRIFNDGTKTFKVFLTSEEKKNKIKYQSRKKGNFGLIGAIALYGDEFIICEGFATGATLYEATNKIIIVAIDSSNIIHVTKNIKNKFPNSKIIIAADNDANNKKNVGIEKAQEAKDMFDDIKITYPIFSIEEAKKGYSDFNDLYMLRGLNSVNQYLNNI